MNRWRRALIPFLLFVLAFSFYQFEVEHPPIIVFDEAHYVKVARNYTNGVLIDPAWSDPRPQNFEHPPFAKYLVAAGIWINGKPHNEWAPQPYITQLCGQDNPECARDAYGWRLASTVVGASGVAAAYLLAIRLFHRLSAGLFAAGLLLLDGLYYLHARLAMLDVFPTAFALWAFAFLFSPSPRGRWWAALFFGLALASKYYVLFLVPLFLLAQFVRGPVPRWREPPPPPEPGLGLVPPRNALNAAWRSAAPWVQRVGLAVLLSLVVPFLVLAATYLPYFVLWTRMDGFGFAVREWMFVQVSAFTWDFAGSATHPFTSTPITWIPLMRPVFYYTHDYASGLVGRMYSIGNPFLWWTATAGLLAVPALILVRFFRGAARHYLRWDFLEGIVYYPFPLRRDLAFLLAALFFYAAYAPWFLLQRILFVFYMTFVVPSFALFAGGLLGEQWDRGGLRRILSILYLVLAMAVFGIYYPVVTGIPIEAGHFRWIMQLIPWMRG